MSPDGCRRNTLYCMRLRQTTLQHSHASDYFFLLFGHPVITCSIRLFLYLSLSFSFFARSYPFFQKDVESSRLYHRKMTLAYINSHSEQKSIVYFIRCLSTFYIFILDTHTQNQRLFFVSTIKMARAIGIDLGTTYSVRFIFETKYRRYICHIFHSVSAFFNTVK
jgi:hypothetical protein